MNLPDKATYMWTCGQTRIPAINYVSIRMNPHPFFIKLNRPPILIHPVGEEKVKPYQVKQIVNDTV